MITHPLPEEHPLRLEDVPVELLDAWLDDAYLRAHRELWRGDDRKQRLAEDVGLLRAAIPDARDATVVLCPSCGCPISPTGDCRCSD